MFGSMARPHKARKPKMPKPPAAAKIPKIPAGASQQHIGGPYQTTDGVAGIAPPSEQAAPYHAMLDAPAASPDASQAGSA